MHRRLYFLLPDQQHTRSVVDELVHEGISVRSMHAHSASGKPLDGLPASSLRQTNDAADHLEDFLWNANLLSFVVAFAIFIILASTIGANLWLFAPIIVMATNFLIGVHFVRLPNTRLNEFRDALAHGEILLMVDVTEDRVADIENLVHHHHPEAAVGGVSWRTPAFGL